MSVAILLILFFTCWKWIMIAMVAMIAISGIMYAIGYAVHGLFYWINKMSDYFDHLFHPTRRP